MTEMNDVVIYVVRPRQGRGAWGGRGEAINWWKAAVSEAAEKLPQKDLLAFSRPFFFVRPFLLSLCFPLIKLQIWKHFSLLFFPFSAADSSEKWVKPLLKIMRQIRFRGVNDDVSIHRSSYSIYRAPISPDDVGSAPRTAQTELQKHHGLHLQPLHPHPRTYFPTVCRCRLCLFSWAQQSYIVYQSLALIAIAAVWQLCDEFFQPADSAQRRS